MPSCQPTNSVTALKEEYTKLSIWWQKIVTEAFSFPDAGTLAQKVARQLLRARNNADSKYLNHENQPQSPAHKMWTKLTLRIWFIAQIFAKIGVLFWCIICTKYVEFVKIRAKICSIHIYMLMLPLQHIHTDLHVAESYKAKCKNYYSMGFCITKVDRIIKTCNCICKSMPRYAKLAHFCIQATYDIKIKWELLKILTDWLIDRETK